MTTAMIEPDDETLRAWLLHRLPDDRAIALEERLLLDDAFGVRLRAVETDLIDDYARDQLDPAQRAAAERWLLATPADRERLRAAHALAALALPRRGAAAAAPSPVASPVRRTRRRRAAWLAFGAAAAALLLALYLPLRQSVAPPRSAAPSAVAVETITLTADLSRSASDAAGVAVRLPAADAVVRLQVEIASAATGERYVLRLRTPARDVLEVRDLVAQSEGVYRFVQATLPPATLAAGDYRLFLAAAGDGAAAQEWTLHVRAQ